MVGNLITFTCLVAAPSFYFYKTYFEIRETLPEETQALDDDRFDAIKEAGSWKEGMIKPYLIGIAISAAATISVILFLAVL
ncbi:MAG: hypothetical protein AAGE43_05370 [Pseudomonadota bacterium]